MLRFGLVNMTFMPMQSHIPLCMWKIKRIVLALFKHVQNFLTPTVSIRKSIINRLAVFNFFTIKKKYIFHLGGKAFVIFHLKRLGKWVYKLFLLYMRLALHIVPIGRYLYAETSNVYCWRKHWVRAYKIFSNDALS